MDIQKFFRIWIMSQKINIRYPLVCAMRTLIFLVRLQSCFANFESESTPGPVPSYQPEPAMSNPRAACGPVDGFVRPSLGLRCSIKVSYILTTCLYVDNLESDIFDAGGPQCLFTMSFTIAVRIRMLSVH